MPSTLVLGGARSGKTAWAQRRAEGWGADGGRLVMIVSAQAHDAEMAERIARHRADRSGAWTTVEAPVDLVTSLASLGHEDIAVVDCLTLWLSNLMHAGRDVPAEFARLTAAITAAPSSVVLVTNEVGFGIVPDSVLARSYRDHLGTLSQQVAAVCDRVVLVCAGLPLTLK